VPGTLKFELYPSAKSAAEQTPGFIHRMLAVSQASRVCIMIHHKEPQSHSMAEINRDNAFRAQLIRTIPAMPVVISRPLVDASGRAKAVRAPHWLSGFVTSPAAVAASPVVSPIDDRAAKNLANWSSYLPADCVQVMVSLGWDRTT